VFRAGSGLGADAARAHTAGVKAPKKKIALPRRTWQINPVTRVKDSAKKYRRARVKQALRKSNEE
jgi:hypothetical protein